METALDHRLHFTLNLSTVFEGGFQGRQATKSNELSRLACFESLNFRVRQREDRPAHKVFEMIKLVAAILANQVALSRPMRLS